MAGPNPKSVSAFSIQYYVCTGSDVIFRVQGAASQHNDNRVCRTRPVNELSPHHPQSDMMHAVSMPEDLHSPRNCPDLAAAGMMASASAASKNSLVMG